MSEIRKCLIKNKIQNVTDWLEDHKASLSYPP